MRCGHLARAGGTVAAVRVVSVAFLVVASSVVIIQLLRGRTHGPMVSWIPKRISRSMPAMRSHLLGHVVEHRQQR
jgi:uncharacterized spore protein YtfJ